MNGHCVKFNGMMMLKYSKSNMHEFNNVTFFLGRNKSDANSEYMVLLIKI